MKFRPTAPELVGLTVYSGSHDWMKPCDSDGGHSSRFYWIDDNDNDGVQRATWTIQRVSRHTGSFAWSLQWNDLVLTWKRSL